MSQEEVARKMGVTTRTLRHWEKAESWPSPTQIHTLCYILGAYRQEILALAGPESRFELGNQNEQPTLEELAERNKGLHKYASDPHIETLKDLGFLALQSQAWPLAARSESGRQVLGHIHSHHANYYSAYRRWHEGALQANRALELLSLHRSSDNIALQANIAAARCLTYKSKRPAPERGLEILRPWIDVVSTPTFQSWVLSDIAKYEALKGNTSYSLEMATKARKAALRGNSAYDFCLRELDEAQILLQLGEAAQALEIVEGERPYLQPEHLAQFRLLEAEAALTLRDGKRVADCVNQVQQLVEQKSLTHLQERIGRVINRL